MLRILPEERVAILHLIENEASHLTTAREPVHYMIYGRNAEHNNINTVSDNLRKVRRAALRLASQFQNDVSRNRRCNGHMEENKENRTSEFCDDFYQPQNYIQMHKADESRSSGVTSLNLMEGSDADAVDDQNKELDKVLPNGKMIISIRLLCSPPNYKAQNFHFDYGQDFETVHTMFVAITPSVVGNSTELLRWNDGEVATKARHISRRRNRLVIDKDVIFTDNKEPTSTSENDVIATKKPDDVIVTRKPDLISLEMEQWDIAVVKTSHHFHRRGDTFASNFTRLMLNIDLADAPDERLTEVDDVVRNDVKDVEDDDFVCIDTLRSLTEERICGTEIIDNMYEQDIVLVGKLY